MHSGEGESGAKERLPAATYDSQRGEGALGEAEGGYGVPELYSRFSPPSLGSQALGLSMDRVRATPPDGMWRHSAPKIQLSSRGLPG
jgi:hypothetical protein